MVPATTFRMCSGGTMRGAHYEYNYQPRSRIVSVLRFTVLVTALMAGIFYLIVNWPDNWDEIIINTVRAIRMM